MTTENPVWATLTRDMLDVLREIDEAWSADEYHDVPLALIERAREVVRRMGEPA